jgi:hypothetical protein
MASVTSSLCLLLLVCSLTVTAVTADNDNDSSKTLQKSWTLLHSFGGSAGSGGSADFTKRGTITLSIDETASDPADAVTMEIENQVEFTPADVQAMLDNQWYQLKIEPASASASGAGKNSNKDGSLSAVRTSVPACQLRRANFRYVSISSRIVSVFPVCLLNCSMV